MCPDTQTQAHVEGTARTQHVNASSQRSAGAISAVNSPALDTVHRWRRDVRKHRAVIALHDTLHQRVPRLIVPAPCTQAPPSRVSGAGAQRRPALARRQAACAPNTDTHGYADASTYTLRCVLSGSYTASKVNFLGAASGFFGFWIATVPSVVSQIMMGFRFSTTSFPNSGRHRTTTFTASLLMVPGAAAETRVRGRAVRELRVVPS